MSKYSQQYSMAFDKDVLNDLKKIDDSYKKEIENGNPDEEKLLQLKMQKLYRGMELNAGFIGGRFGFRPY